MFDTQITFIESQRQIILNQIEKLTCKEQALIQESLQYKEMASEATNLLSAISALKDKFSNHGDASSALLKEISKLWNTENSEVVVEAPVTPVLRYETASEIESALADAEEIDTHLMAIASILDSCPAEETSGRVWFFVQNIRPEFDPRILGYLPKTIKADWEKQRAFELEKVAVEPVAEPHPEIQPGDHVEIHTGEVCPVLQVEAIEGRFYVEVLRHGRKESYRPSDLKPATEPTTETISEPVSEPVVVVASVAEPASDLQPEQPQQSHYFEVGDLVQIPEGKVGHITEIEYDNRAGQRIASIACPGGTYYHPTNDLKYIGKYQVTQSFEIDDLVQLPDGRKCRVKQVATVDGSQLVDVILPDGTNGAYKPVSLTKIGKFEPATETPSEPSKTATKAKKSKKSKTTVADILKCKTYAEIRAIANNDSQLIKDAAISAKTKAEKELIEKLPELIRDYMYETHNFDDLDWLPAYVVQRVRCLFSAPGTPATAEAPTSTEANEAAEAA